MFIYCIKLILRNELASIGTILLHCKVPNRTMQSRDHIPYRICFIEKSYRSSRRNDELAKWEVEIKFIAKRASTADERERMIYVRYDVSSRLRELLDVYRVYVVVVVVYADCSVRDMM